MLRRESVITDGPYKTQPAHQHPHGFAHTPFHSCTPSTQSTNQPLLESQNLYITQDVYDHRTLSSMLRLLQAISVTSPFSLVCGDKLEMKTENRIIQINELIWSLEFPTG